MTNDEWKFELLRYRFQVLLLRLGFKRHARMRIDQVLCWWLLLPTRWIRWVLDIPRRRELARNERYLRRMGYWDHDEP